MHACVCVCACKGGSVCVFGVHVMCVFLLLLLLLSSYAAGYVFVL